MTEREEIVNSKSNITGGLAGPLDVKLVSWASRFSAMAGLLYRFAET
jgi:hypothetical protein